jgi:superoxide dismutase, Cu-Zn family
MTIRTTFAAIVAMALLPGCEGSTDVGLGPDELEWQGVVTGVNQDWAHLSAEAAMRWVEGENSFTAGIALSGDEPGAVRPWHVHVNSCAEGGGIFGSDGDYPRLVVGADGTASVVTDVPQVPNPAVPYHVNVHLSQEEMGVVIACGDIVLEVGNGQTQQRPPPNIPGY